MFRKTFTFTETFTIYEVGDIVAQKSFDGAMTHEGLYEIIEVYEPIYPGDVPCYRVKAMATGVEDIVDLSGINK